MLLAMFDSSIFRVRKLLNLTLIGQLIYRILKTCLFCLWMHPCSKKHLVSRIRLVDACLWNFIWNVSNGLLFVWCCHEAVWIYQRANLNCNAKVRERIWTAKQKIVLGFMMYGPYVPVRIENSLKVWIAPAASPPACFASRRWMVSSIGSFSWKGMEIDPDWRYDPNFPDRFWIRFPFHSPKSDPDRSMFWSFWNSIACFSVIWSNTVSLGHPKNCVSPFVTPSINRTGPFLDCTALRPFENVRIFGLDRSSNFKAGPKSPLWLGRNSRSYKAIVSMTVDLQSIRDERSDLAAVPSGP